MSVQWEDLAPSLQADLQKIADSSGATIDEVMAAVHMIENMATSDVKGTAEAIARMRQRDED